MEMSLLPVGGGRDRSNNAQVSGHTYENRKLTLTVPIKTLDKLGYCMFRSFKTCAIFPASLLIELVKN